MAFKYSLNASTLFSYKLGVMDQIRIAAEAGYDGIELWVRDIERFLQEGGSLRELKSVIQDSGIQLVNAIAFFAWADADIETRDQAFVQAEREMRMLTELGCKAVAAPPFGNVSEVSLKEMGACFARLSELSRTVGIEAYLEFWGRAPRLSTLSEAVYVAMESGKPDAKLLLDPFHMFTGGSGVEGISYLNGDCIGIVHANDYPNEPARDVIQDRHRVMPGDGIAPLRQLAGALRQIGYAGFLSLELFMEDVGSRSAADLAQLGLEKMKNAFSGGE